MPQSKESILSDLDKARKILDNIYNELTFIITNYESSQTQSSQPTPLAPTDVAPNAPLDHPTNNALPLAMRKKIINALIESHIDMSSGDYNLTLQEILENGFKGYDNMTDQELTDICEINNMRWSNLL